MKKRNIKQAAMAASGIAPAANHKWYLPPCESSKPSAFRKTTKRYNCRLAAIAIKIITTAAPTNFVRLGLIYIMNCSILYSEVKGLHARLSPLKLCQDLVPLVTLSTFSMLR
jgi:hypothetical protein